MDSFFVIRKATLDDQTDIAELIGRSVRGLSRTEYTPQQIELSLQTVFGVDTDLIRDDTYFVALGAGRIVGCGGWSYRKTLYGAHIYAHSRAPQKLDPRTDAAKIRAFFIDPDWSRRGIGTAILKHCESEARAFGFRAAEMMATLPGVKLYQVRGYTGDERVSIDVGAGLAIECVRMRKPL